MSEHQKCTSGVPPRFCTCVICKPAPVDSVAPTVVDLDSRRPHVVEAMRCRKCSHEFTSVHIAGIVRTDWQCSACGKMACAPSGWNTGGMWGYFKDGKFVPEGWQS